MIYKSIIVLLCLFTIKSDIANAVTIQQVPISPQVKTTEQLIDEKAKLYQVSPIVMHAVIKCESQYNPNAIGDGGHSRGLVQIYDDFHPTVTHAQAFDPEFAITFLAKNLAQEKGYQWTCYRNLNIDSNAI